ncbi:TonB-dependent receptor [Pedobacter faecalis]|uniref:TonB-dependent receptor n=1 Tax=Pedobacter faecalis TaxID=3041495 RepID=UPI00254CEAF6|nr:TonB-dependent receptor [Pedobacter sp. ELA7]
MKKILLMLSLCLAGGFSYAQNTTSIKGVVSDSLTNKNLGLSTVAVVNAKDTSLVSYTVTKDDGTFQLSRLPTTRPLKLIVSYVGYNTYRRELMLKPGELNLGIIKLNGRSLDEIVIKGERTPVMLKKDTIEFNAEAFKTRPNAAVEELLRLLPGVQVNENGEILVNGRGTSRILIDGKEFFGTNQLVALKNLDAELIDKIQVYLDRENDPDRRISEINLQNIINLKLKSAVKKSTIGRFAGGAGTRDRYEASGVLSSFRDTLQFSVLGATNNLNSTGFSRDELFSMGGFNRSGSDLVDNGNFGGSPGGGFTTVRSGGLNVNNDYGTRLKLNLAYFFGNTIHSNETRVLNEQFLDNTVVTSWRTDASRRSSYSHVVGGLMEWKPDTNTVLRYRPAMNFSPGNSRYQSLLNLSNTIVDRISETDGHNYNRSYSDAFSHNLNYYKRFKKGRSLTLNNVLTLDGSGTDAYNFSQLTPLTSTVEPFLLDRHVKSGSSTRWSGLSILYNLPLTKKLTAEFFTNSRYYRWAQPVESYDLNPSTTQYDRFIDDQSNDFVRTGFFQNIKPLLNYQVNPKLRIRAAIDLEIQNVNNKFNASANDIRQRFTVWFPSLTIDYDRFSVSYSEWIDLPSLYNMQPLERVSSAQYKFVGNPELSAIRVRRLNGNFYKYNTPRMLGLSGYANATFYENSFVQQTLTDENGFTTATVVNKDGRSSINGGINLNKQFKKSQKWQFSMNTGLSGYAENQVIFLNNQEARQRYGNIGFTQNLNVNYKSLALVNLSYRNYHSFTTYTNNFNDVTNNTQVLGASGTFRLPKKIVIESNYSYRHAPQIGQGFTGDSHILNLAVSLLTQKRDRGEFKLSVYDLLNQNISVDRFGSGNSTVMYEQQILRRYIMFNYQYRFNIMKNK